MTRQALSTVVLLLVVLVVFWGMRAGWRARTRRSSALVTSLPEAPSDLGAARLGPVDATYVSTTRAGDWLDRVTAQGLGVRSPAQVAVFDAGVRISRQGATDLFVPAAALRAAAGAPGMAGKVVGGEGLVVLTWQADPADSRGLDTGLRPKHAADRERLLAALETLTPGQAPAQEGS
ncbi:PH-like domain-containing protein [Cellulomonas xylanilytica]|uniref:PH domain-containing protein n=1 Tax=Cellulomonas xylanilytica TaxID=233583 RepID=A0A510UZH2_9CELL|nr:hypothetical protein [Cellulomonas xylanilytica]GEK19989.1 hypothetical protein CXY01_05090 [Cellulomonas xylanilytica]